MALSITQLSLYLTGLDSKPSPIITDLNDSEEIDQGLPWNGLSCLSVVSYVLNRSKELLKRYTSSIILSMALSITQLSKYLTGRDFSSSKQNTSWSNTEETDQDLPWNGLSCLAVVSYVLKFCSVTDHKDVFQAIKRLDVLASEINKSTDEWDLGNLIREFWESFVDTFMPMVKDFFNLPETNSESNKHLAPFLHFLLQVLNSELDHIQPTDSDVLQNDVKYLHGALSFFLTVLGDTMFQYGEIEEVKNLLTGFEAMANEAGSFVYSSVFHTSPYDISSLCVEKIDFLNAKIKEVCIKFQELPQSLYAKTNNTDVADALFIVDSLFEDMETFLAPRIDLVGNLKDQTSNLKNQLAVAQSFLKDVNASRVGENEKLKEHIVQIREASCEADYLINSFVVGNFPQWYFSLRIPNVIEKLELIGKRFIEIKTNYGINIPNLENDLSSQAKPVAVDDNVFVGFETEMQDIQDQIKYGSSDLQTISVYGMPGLGKTTFARKLFNYRRTNHRFDLSAWCVVSQTYERRRMLIDILMGLRKLHTSDEIKKMEDYQLIEHIYKTLKGRRYFIVMDDVWDIEALDDARIFCPNEKNQSRILFTTRNHVTTINSNIARTLPFLTDAQCWELLERKLFRDKGCPKELVRCVKRIAEKCNGLPLTVVVIAGILSGMSMTKSKWGEVENTINIHAKSSMKVLELSYKHLPNHLKLCFLYFGVYPEDKMIDVQNLIWSWISEGFIHHEHVARKYLKDLVDRSLVQVIKNGSTGRVKFCNMHDVVRDMCLRRGTEENFMSMINDYDVSIYERHLRLSISSTTPTSMRPFSVHCRSFHGQLSDPSSCLPQMKHLRIMQLRSHNGVNRSYKLKRVDMLVHLKYLVVDRMPQVNLDRLVNLEILVVNTESKVSVPSRILKMKKLRHLHVTREFIFQNDRSIPQPNNLESLSCMFIRNDTDYGILTPSTHLRKLKCFCSPELPDFRVLSELEWLKITVRAFRGNFGVRGKSGVHNSININLPLTITKLSLSDTHLPWERMSVIAELRGLQSLKLLRNAFEGTKWDTTKYYFTALIYLKIEKLKLQQWDAWSENFPTLEHLVLNVCDALKEIPLEIGEINTMKLIEVHDCSAGVLQSVSEMEKQQAEFGNTDLKFITASDK